MNGFICRDDDGLYFMRGKPVWNEAGGYFETPSAMGIEGDLLLLEGVDVDLPLNHWRECRLVIEQTTKDSKPAT